jgi:hypothetical protein
VGFVLHLQIQYISMIDVVLLSQIFSNLSYCRRSWAADVAATFDESGDELSATSVIEVNVTFGPYRRVPLG